MKNPAAFIGLWFRSGANCNDASAFTANSIGIRHDELCLVRRIRIEIQDAACKHVGSNDIHLGRLINPFTFQTEKGQCRFPRRLAFLPVRYGYRRVAILIALNEPLESRG